MWQVQKVYISTRSKYTNYLCKPEPAIAIRDLHKSYGSFNAVNGVSLTVEQGDVYGFLGPNGAGQWGRMPEAARAESDLTATDDVVLFSPACKSFDMFANFEERGRAFKQIVTAL